LRRISVNSFGFGGSNAHAILDDAYHTLEALSVRNGLRVIGPPELALPATSNGDCRDSVKATGLALREVINGTTPGNDSRSTPKVDNVASSAINIVASSTINGLAATVSGRKSPSINGLDRKINSFIVSNGTTSSRHKLLVFTARDEAALKRVHQQYTHYYDRSIHGSPKTLQDLAYTLAARRNAMAMRSFTVANSNWPSSTIGLPSLNCVRLSREPQLCFVFTGQGAQYAKMGLALIEYPVFKNTLTQAEHVFRRIGAEWSLLGMLFYSFFLTYLIAAD
jgi:acyl transferase domain-containing protein